MYLFEAYCLPLNYTQQVISNDTYDKTLYFTVGPCNKENLDCVDLSLDRNRKEFLKKYKDYQEMYFFYTNTKFFPSDKA